MPTNEIIRVEDRSACEADVYKGYGCGRSSLDPIGSRPSQGTLIAYGALAFPVWISVIPIVNYLPAFYAQELHLSAGLVGMVFLAARLWDGLSDLLVGWLSDRSMSRWGRRKPWVIGAALFFAAAPLVLCEGRSNPELLSGAREQSCTL